MAMSDSSAPLNLTVPKKHREYLELLVSRGTNLGTSVNGIAAFIVMRELNRMMKKEPNALYWQQGLPGQ